jgi:cell division protein FtsW
MTLDRPVLVNSPAMLLALIVATLVSLGIVMVYSASGARAGLETRRAAAAQAELPAEDFVFHHQPSYARKQILWTAIGFAALLVLMRLPIDRLEAWVPWIMLACLVLLVAVVATPLGVTSKGATRWLRLGPVTIQPAEFAKIGLVLFMARFLAQKREEIRDLRRGFVPAFLVWFGFTVLIMLERDLGTIVLMTCVIGAMWLMAGMRWLHLAAIAMLAVPAGIALVFQHAYRINRVLAVLNPEAYASTHGFQLNQSLIAVGSGGLWGRGLGLGLQKYHFLSEAHTDFIFAIVCEELGFLGAVSVVLLFLAFIILGVRISYRAPDYFAGLAAAGLTLTIGFAAFINFFVVLGMAPTKGLALPFFTYGGSSMLACLAAVGLLINIANYTTRSRGGD